MSTDSNDFTYYYVVDWMSFVTNNLITSFIQYFDVNRKINDHFAKNLNSNDNDTKYPL